MFRIAVSIAALALAAPPIAVAHGGLHLSQSAQEEVIIEATDLGNGIFMLVGQGGNIGVSTGDDGVFVIDSQFANIAPKNLAKIREIAGDDPTYLVNTHWHGDHTGGNANFGATIIAHDNVRGRLITDQNTVLLGNERNTPAAPQAAWPVITFDDDLALHLNGQTIRVFHTPDAHTDGDAMVYFEEADVLHMGDVFFVGRFPFIDISSGGTVGGFLSALKIAHDIAGDNTQVIPGHGPLATRADIAASIDMLQNVSNAVHAAIADGMNADEAVAANILAEWADTWGSGFINAEVFTRLLYDDFERVAAESAEADLLQAEDAEEREEAPVPRGS